MSAADFLSTTSTNEDALFRVYDPAYVRQVALPTGGAPVQVCLDSRMLGLETGTGVATYAAVLARCLGAAGAAPTVLDDVSDDGEASPRPRLARWIAALDRRARPAREKPATPESDNPRDGAGWAAADVFREAQVFFNVHGRLMPVVCAQPPQVMHWTYPVPLYVQGARNLYTIHDLIPLSDPALTSIAPGRHRRLLRQIADRAHRLVAVSETMRRAIIAELGCDPAAVVNTYQAAITPLQRDPALPAGLKPGGFFIVCGTVEPRKNIAALIAAHAEAATSLPLVVVGPSAAGAEAVEAAIRVAPHVIRLPWQPRPVLLGLIRRARALLFPTLAEGFGLPIIEAMSLGAPVMTSFRGAPAEVAGSAALLIDPEHRSAMAAAIADLATNDALCAQLRASGFERARMFAPAAYQRRLRALYADALSTTPGAATGSQP